MTLKGKSTVMTYRINILELNSRATDSAEIEFGELTLSFRYKDIYIAKDQCKPIMPFGLLLELRSELELQNIYLLCAGSRYDVMPSHNQFMSTKAYIHHLGLSEQPEDIVDIFEPVKDADIMKVKTVCEQWEYHHLWLFG